MPDPIQPAISNNFKTILEQVAAEAFQGRQPLRSVASGGTALTWRSVDEFMGTSPHLYNGVTLHVLTDAAPVADIDQSRLITKFDGRDDFTVQSAWDGYTPAAGDVALLYYGASADLMKHAVNKTLKDFQLPKIEPATLVRDGNMDKGGVTDWTALGGAGDPVKDTSFALFGTHSLHLPVLNTAAQGVASAPIPVSTGSQVLVSVPLMMHGTTGTASGVTVTLRDLDAGETIASQSYTGPLSVADEPLQLWHWYLFVARIPNTCRTVDIRVNYAGGANVQVYIDHMGFLSSYDKQVSLPDGIRSTDVYGFKRMDLGTALQGATGGNGAVYAGQSFVPRAMPNLRGITQYGAVDPYRIIVPWAMSRPIFFDYLDPSPTLATLSATTIAPLEQLIPGSVARVFEGMAARTKDPMAQNKWTGLMHTWDAKFHDALKDDELDTIVEPGQRRVPVR